MRDDELICMLNDAADLAAFLAETEHQSPWRQAVYRLVRHLCEKAAALLIEQQD